MEGSTVPWISQRLCMMNVGLSDNGCSQQIRQEVSSSYWLNLLELCRSVITERTNHRIAMAVPLQGLTLREYGYDQFMSLVSVFLFTVRLDNPKVTLPQWVIYLFLHDRLYRQSLQASERKMVSDSILTYKLPFVGKQAACVHAIYPGNGCWCYIRIERQQL